MVYYDGNNINKNEVLINFDNRIRKGYTAEILKKIYLIHVIIHFTFILLVNRYNSKYKILLPLQNHSLFQVR